MSTVDVYGDATGEVAEDRPVLRVGADYGDSKLGAEEVCRSFVERGLAVSIIRSTIMYGPFSALWTEESAERPQVRPGASPRSCAAVPATWSTSPTLWRGSSSHWTDRRPCTAGSSTAAAPRR